MANFKGGFAFNNEAAKVEVKQAPDGTLISCVNPVTGESLGGANYSEVIEGTLAAPFGDYTRSELYALLEAHSISIECIADGSALGMGTIPLLFFTAMSLDEHVTADIYAELLNSSTGDWATINWYKYDDALEAQDFIAFRNGTSTNLTTYMASIPTVLTIYHHPMPE